MKLWRLVLVLAGSKRENDHEKINQNSHRHLHFSYSFLDHGVYQLFLEGRIL